MMGARINQVAEPHLRNPPEPLEIGMGDKIKNQVIGYGYKSVNWIIEKLQLGRSLQRNGFCDLKGRKLPPESSINRRLTGITDPVKIKS
jgi:hypothetical protein